MFLIWFGGYFLDPLTFLFILKHEALVFFDQLLATHQFLNLILKDRDKVIEEIK